MENGGEGLGHHIGQHIQAAAVGHAKDDFLDAQLPAALDDLLKGRNHAFAAIKAETLGAGVFHVEKILEAFALNEFAENGLLAFAG